MKQAQMIYWRQGLAIVISWGVLSTAGQAMTIDDFSEGGFDITASDNSPGTVDVKTNLSAGAVIGGERRAILGSLDGPPGASAVLDTGLQRLTFTCDPNSRGYLDLEYGFDSPLGIDLTADGDDQFEIELLSSSADLSSGLFNLNLDTGIVPITADSVSFANQIQGFAGGGGTIMIPFSAFPNTDLTNVQSIQISLGRVKPGAELVFGGIRTTPEPATALLLSGALALLIRRR